MSGTQVKSFKPKGLYSAPVTPFKENGDLDLEAIPAYIQHHVDFGVLGVFVNGTNGEGLSMTVAERKAAAEAWINGAKGKLNGVIVHIGAGNLRDSQDLARHAESIGADAIACVGPTYFKPANIDDYVEYMRLVAAEAPKTPFYLYDIAFVTEIHLDVVAFMKQAVSQIPTLVGVKHTTPNFPSMNNILVNHDGAMQVILGSDELWLESLSIGVDVNIMSSVLGHAENRIMEAFARGDFEAARKDQNRILQFANIRKKYNMMLSNIPGGSKCVLRILGIPVGQSRLPLSPVSAETEAKVKQELQAIGYFDWGMKK